MHLHKVLYFTQINNMLQLKYLYKMQVFYVYKTELVVVKVQSGYKYGNTICKLLMLK